MNTRIDATAILTDARQVAQALREVPLAARVKELRRLLAKLRDQREEVIDRIVAETGKSRTDALVSEVMGTLDYLHWLAGAAPGALCEQRVSTPLALFGKKSRIWHEPLGVVLVITPWNYPLHIALTTIATAFVAGNAVLLKPSEHTPLAGLFEELVADLPWLSQALTVVQGDGSCAQALIEARPDKICFTGSTRTGRRILAQAAPLLIPVELELGGKDAMLVFDDVDLGRTTAGALWGALTNGGQSCTAVERLYVQRGIYDEMVSRLRSGIDALVVNSGDEGDADIGAMTTGFQCDIVERHLDDARAKGAVVHGGGRVSGTHMLRPALVTGMTDDMLLMQEETFGPVLPVLPFTDEADAIRLANNSRFGLSASVWSKDLTRARRVAAALNAGAVSINNVMLTEGNPALPFGGVGESGYGRTKGVQGLLGMTRSKAVLIDKQSRKIEANWFPYTRRKYQLFGELVRGLFGHGLGALIRFARAGITLENTAQKPRQPEDK
ncbi:aldehyde dehydrogenase family protein [Alcanivorax quisquiliarum]|uniref:Aldehyde dehydrogenase n=1 Tax=Alcanivorax quisquiliarum TaxID=2933565 RepID=A0ABT0E3F4_9GAMM|nr:aldehyde dehydrogenase family protein [Alcanivorax quisquiliarum]MCK0536350.1 aldehyde dehydrogenase family protein [Alcanivorax quisquiliarum]